MSTQTSTSVVAPDDFPFYNEKPVKLSGAQWALLMISTAIAFAILITPFAIFEGGLMHFVPAILFFAIPLGTLKAVAPHNWTALFRPLRIKDITLTLGFVILSMIGGIVTGLIVTALYGTNPNATMTQMLALGTQDQLLFFLRTVPQLFGEEFLALLPFLAFLTFFHSHFMAARKTSIALALVASSIIFGLAHLPAYDWNFVQCIVVIGTSRALLTLSYLVTKNIWISTATHIIYDWTFFIAAIVFL